MSTNFISILIRILGFIVFLLGLYFIRVTYIFFRQIFYAKVVTILPMSSDQGVKFELTDTYRTYGIWLKGKLLKKASVAHFKPIIINRITGEVVHLRKFFLGASSNNTKNAYIQLFWFKAKAGSYIFQKTKESSLSSINTAFNNRLVPTQVKQLNLEDFYLELRKDLHPVYFQVLIFSMLASFFFTFLGVFMFLGTEKF